VSETLSRPIITISQDICEAYNYQPIPSTFKPFHFRYLFLVARSFGGQPRRLVAPLRQLSPEIRFCIAVGWRHEPALHQRRRKKVKQLNDTTNYFRPHQIVTIRFALSIASSSSLSSSAHKCLFVCLSSPCNSFSPESGPGPRRRVSFQRAMVQIARGFLSDRSSVQELDRPRLLQNIRRKNKRTHDDESKKLDAS